MVLFLFLFLCTYPLLEQSSDTLAYQAELYRMKREYAKAEPLFLESVQRLEQALGPLHERYAGGFSSNFVPNVVFSVLIC